MRRRLLAHRRVHARKGRGRRVNWSGNPLSARVLCRNGTSTAPDAARTDIVHLRLPFVMDSSLRDRSHQGRRTAYVVSMRLVARIHARGHVADSLECPHPHVPRLQALNSLVYRGKLKERVEAGSPGALQAQSNAREREQEKWQRLCAARDLAHAEERKRAAEKRKRKRTAEEQGLADEEQGPSIPHTPAVIEGQCEGTTKAGNRCRVHRKSWLACANPAGAARASAHCARPGQVHRCAVRGHQERRHVLHGLQRLGVPERAAAARWPALLLPS